MPAVNSMKSSAMKDFARKMAKFLASLCGSIWRVGREDPRRVIHAVKVGIALTLVSFLYVLEPLFQGIGQNAIWAVMTVVVVFEFTVGATLCKGLNRGLGTLCAGSLAFFIEVIAEKTGTVFRAAFIGTSVFLIGFLTTYLRFCPKIKKNYDYGLVIFLLTFNLLTVSSFRVQNVMHTARERLYTIAIGCAICLIMSLIIFPNWSGEDLHHSTVYKLEGLSRSIEACVNDYFQDKKAEVTEEESPKDPIYEGYRKVLDSKSSDEALAFFASWEPRHSRHCYRYPWQQYVKLGAVLRHFGYTAVALHGCLESEIQTPRSILSLFANPCTRVAREVSKVLMELAYSIRNRCHCSPDVLSDHLNEALQDLNSAIKSQPRLFLGSKNARGSTKIPADWKQEKEASSEAVLPSVKTDVSNLMEWRNKRVSDQPKESSERKTLKPTLSKIAITGLEFSEALPFAAVASLLVEMVARLELVIMEVNELARAAHFKEFSAKDEILIRVDSEVKGRSSGREIQTHVTSETMSSTPKRSNIGKSKGYHGTDEPGVKISMFPHKEAESPIQKPKTSLETSENTSMEVEQEDTFDSDFGGGLIREERSQRKTRVLSQLFGTHNRRLTRAKAKYRYVIDVLSWDNNT